MSNSKLNTKKLIECRKKLGISKVEAARRIGISQPAYLRYEAGDRNPSLQTIAAIAKILGTSPEYLTDCSESAEPNEIIININDQPVLFEIAKQLKDRNAEQMERILQYVKKL